VYSICSVSIILSNPLCVCSSSERFILQLIRNLILCEPVALAQHNTVTVPLLDSCPGAQSSDKCKCPCWKTSTTEQLFLRPSKSLRNSLEADSFPFHFPCCMTVSQILCHSTNHINKSQAAMKSPSIPNAQRTFQLFSTDYSRNKGLF
jgi:hypothetical protein